MIRKNKFVTNLFTPEYLKVDHGKTANNIRKFKQSPVFRVSWAEIMKFVA